MTDKDEEVYYLVTVDLRGDVTEELSKLEHAKDLKTRWQKHHPYWTIRIHKVTKTYEEIE